MAKNNELPHVIMKWQNHELKETDIKNRTHYRFNAMININYFILKKKIKNHIEIFSFTTLDMKNQMMQRNEYIDNNNGSKYLTLIHTDGNKGEIKKH